MIVRTSGAASRITGGPDMAGASSASETYASAVTTPSATTRPAGENWDGLRNIALRYGWPVG
jgi:hypothetical protein